MHGTELKRQLQPLHGISRHGMPSLQDFTARHGIARKVPDYYAIPDLKNLGVSFYEKEGNLSSIIKGNDLNYNQLFNKAYSKYSFILNGYFEDYTHFEKDIDKIKSWYTPITKRTDNDLVIHFRAGDRLFYKNEFDTKPLVDNYLKAIEQFEFKKLHIITDMPKWEKITIKELQPNGSARPQHKKSLKRLFT